MDFSQYHSYNEKHPADMLASKTARFMKKYNKPFFVSEYGTDWRGWKPEGDPYLRALHQAVWSGAFSGSAGTAMSWWWERIHAEKLHPHWSALAAVLRGTGIATPAMKPAAFKAGSVKKVKAYGVASEREALVWLLDPAFNWPEGAMVEAPPSLEGAEVVLDGLEDGAYSVEWRETMSGTVAATHSGEVQGGSLRLTPPPFKVDTAARVVRR